ncbi:MAG TPA: deoxyguanosinetriphosphate triphosphohydrolase, partial [Chitinophagaceae bacterium]
AQRLGILKAEEVLGSFEAIMRALNRPGENVDKTLGYYRDIEDRNEGIAFLRAKLINLLALEATDVFMANEEDILKGEFNDTLIDNLEQRCPPLKDMMKLSVERIYNHDTVTQIEIAGYNVMSELLQLFIPALLKEKPSHKEQKVLKLFPYQFTEFQLTDSRYEKVMSALDLLSGMTDTYATELYRRLKGIVIPQHD